MDLRDAFTSIFKLAKKVDHNGPLRLPGAVCDWAGWVYEWDQLRSYCLAATEATPNGAAVKKPTSRRGSRKSKVIQSLVRIIDKVFPDTESRRDWKAIFAYMKQHHQDLLDKAAKKSSDQLFDMYRNAKKKPVKS